MDIPETPPPRIKISLEAGFYEERSLILSTIHAIDLQSNIFDALNLIRSRLKYGENVSDTEEKTLDEIRDALLDNVSGLF